MYCYYTAVSYDGPFTLAHVIKLANQLVAEHVKTGDITIKAEVHIWHNEEKKLVALVAGVLDAGDGWVKLL